MMLNIKEKISLLKNKIDEFDLKICTELEIQSSNDPENLLWMIDERQKLIKYFEIVITEAIDAKVMDKDEMQENHDFIGKVLDRDSRIIAELQAIQNETKKSAEKIKVGKKAVKSYDKSPT
jgi:hypothetical protein